MTTSHQPDYPELLMKVFRGENPGRVIWQPRIEYWYLANRKRGTLPAHLRDASLLDVYDYCHASCRYFLWDDAWLRVRYQHVEITQEKLDEKRVRQTWHTPVGSISQVSHYDEWDISSHIVEYRLKSPADFDVLRYILQDEEWYWDEANYQSYLERFGAHGIPQFYFRRSPIQRLIIEDMSFEQTIFFMQDYPDLLKEYIDFATEADDHIYAILENCPVPVLNLGENIDAFLDSPTLWKQYLQPYYTGRVNQLRAAGKYVHIHMDGALKPLLNHMQDCAWDGIEAATPVPQGDVTLEAIKSAMGDRVLLDGIPALYFLPRLYPAEDLMTCAQRVVDLFYPHLILGISDEIPPDGDIERVRMIGEWAAGLSV
ncbi:MAG: hypothetical protein K8L99_05925 [Anaerolineae bacterium]|nr:hypothetical protein [Anaerolineae bacterium]